MLGFLTHSGYTHGGNGYEGIAFLIEQFRDTGLEDPADPAHGVDLKALAARYTERVVAVPRLLTKLAGIEAHLQMIQATQAGNEFDFDDTALSRAKASVADLEKRLEVMELTAELEGRFTETRLPIVGAIVRTLLRMRPRGAEHDASAADHNRRGAC